MPSARASSSSIEPAAFMAPLMGQQRRESPIKLTEDVGETVAAFYPARIAHKQP